MIEILLAGGLVALIAGLATIVRAEDDPKTPWDKEHLKTHLKTFFFAAVAAGLASWLMGYDPARPDGFISLLGVAYVGYAFVRGLVAGKE